MALTTRQMLRECGFRTADGKLFTKSLHETYMLEAKIYTKHDVRVILVKKINRGIIESQKRFIEGVDYDNMVRYCNILTF